MRPQSLGISALLLVVATLAGTRVEAQTDAEYLSAINFRFENPGAHPRRLGGAFVALANDATAARVNPAGLTLFQHQQASVEFRIAQDDYPAARVETGATSFAVPTQVHPPRRAEMSNDAEHLSYLSWVQPVGQRPFVLGFFYARPLDIDNTVIVEDAAFPEIDPAAIRGASTSLVSASQDMLGASIGIRLGPRFSLGAAVGISKFELLGTSFRRLSDISVVSSESSADETAVFFTVGGLWRATPRLTVGGSWQSPTEYEMSSRDSLQTRVIRSDFTIPSRVALGITVTPADRWLLSLESDWIDYSSMLDDARDKSFFEASLGATDPDYGYAISDVTELHLGVEYLVREGTEGWSLSGGYWRDETNPPYYTGGDAVNAAWAPELDDALHHFTLGVGLRTGQMRFDVAVDVSDDAGTDVLIGVVAWFGQ